MYRAYAVHLVRGRSPSFPVLSDINILRDDGKICRDGYVLQGLQKLCREDDIPWPMHSLTTLRDIVESNGVDGRRKSPRRADERLASPALVLRARRYPSTKCRRGTRSCSICSPRAVLMSSAATRRPLASNSRSLLRPVTSRAPLQSLSVTCFPVSVTLLLFRCETFWPWFGVILLL